MTTKNPVVVRYVWLTDKGRHMLKAIEKMLEQLGKSEEA